MDNGGKEEKNNMDWEGKLAELLFIDYIAPLFGGTIATPFFKP